jgi:hypothetical protein
MSLLHFLIHVPHAMQDGGKNAGSSSVGKESWGFRTNIAAGCCVQHGDLRKCCDLHEHLNFVCSFAEAEM